MPAMLANVMSCVAQCTPDSEKAWHPALCPSELSLAYLDFAQAPEESELLLVFDPVRSTGTWCNSSIRPRFQPMCYCSLQGSLRRRTFNPSALVVEGVELKSKVTYGHGWSRAWMIGFLAWQTRCSTSVGHGISPVRMVPCLRGWVCFAEGWGSWVKREMVSRVGFNLVQSRLGGLLLLHFYWHQHISFEISPPPFSWFEPWCTTTGTILSNSFVQETLEQNFKYQLWVQSSIRFEMVWMFAGPNMPKT